MSSGDDMSVGAPAESATGSVLDSISPDPPGDQVDRAVVMGQAVKQAAMWALRLLIIGIFLYSVGQLVGKFWQGVLPVLLAILVCTVLAPLTSWMRRHHIPGALAAILSILLFFGVVGGLIGFIAPNFARQSQTLYLQTVEGIQRLQLWALGPPLELDHEELTGVVDEVARWLQARAGTIAGSIFSGLGTITSMVVTVLVVLVLMFFFLKDGHSFLPWLRQATGRRTGWHLTEVLTRAWNTLGGFIRAQALVSLIDAVFIGFGLALIGVPLAMALAVITFIAGFIPFVGAIVAGALAVTIALVSVGVGPALLTLLLVLVVQQLEGNVLSPWLQSKAMNLHPVIVLISVTVGSAIFGLVGAFLAVPTVATLAVIYRYVKDMMMLQSGEKTAADIEFVTVAGTLAGRLNEQEGARKRAVWRAEHSASDGDDCAESDAAESVEKPSSAPVSTAPEAIDAATRNHTTGNAETNTTSATAPEASGDEEAKPEDSDHSILRRAEQAREELAALAAKYGSLLPDSLRQRQESESDPLERLINLDSSPSEYSRKKKQGFVERLFGK